MKDVKLLPHNEIGYEKLIECLKNNRIATINHATGTGKSFILLKYMLQHQNKRTIFMSPTYEIIEQIFNEHPKELGYESSELSHVDSMIYPNLLSLKDIEEFVKKYDVFILDEYHRCGSKQWGRIIKKIKEIIQQKYPEKIIIGTTATEIRYLDNEKNMKDLLFDGVEASRLDLVDGMLQGILPVPYYINYDMESLEKIEIIKSRVKKYIFNKKEKEKIIEEIEIIKNQIIESIYNNEEVQKHIKPNGKYLVFSANKEAIKKDKKLISPFFKKEKIQEYVIHSGISREKNKLTLEKFRNANKQDNVHILYSIKLLTEGVHVKDVDAEFQCRKTTSPILYFQIIGRILSYSQRKDKVVIFDLANNLNHHPVIHNLYLNLIERARELIKTNPEKREKYEEILNNLKIVDETNEIYKKIDELEKKYSKENLIKKVIDENIRALENEEKKDYIKIYEAEMNIKKYYKYIDLSMFTRIKKLGIMSDQKLFQFTEEEFKKILKGYDTLYELLNKKNKLSYEKIKKFMSENYRIPSLFSNNKEEQELAIEMCNNYEKNTNAQKKVIRSYIYEEDTIYEKLSFGKKTTNIDYQQLITEIEYIMSINLPINKNVIAYLRSNEQFSKIIKKIDQYNSRVLKEILDDSLKAEEIKYIDLIPGETSDSASELIEEIIENYERDGLEIVLESSYKEIADYIKKYKKMPVYEKKIFKPQDFYDIHSEEKIKSRRAYLLKMILGKLFDIYGYTEKLNNKLLEIKNSDEKKIIDDVIEFMKRNNNRLPSKTTTMNPKEISLALAYGRIKGKLTPEQKSKIEEYSNIYDKNKKEVVNAMCEFILENIGRPTIFTENDIELIKKYKKYEIDFNPDEIKMLERAKKISNLYYFIVKKNYEMPSEKNEDLKEKEFAKFYRAIKKDLSPKEKEIFNLIQEKMLAYKKEFIEKYQEFIKNNKRLPLLNNPEEKELVISYNRWLPYLEPKEKERLSLQSTGVSRFQSMLSAYDAMKGRNK